MNYQAYSQGQQNIPVSMTAPPQSSHKVAGYSTLDLGNARLLTRPYAIRGVHYQPMSTELVLNHSQVGVCSIYAGYGQNSLGEIVPHGMVTAAHKTLPISCVIKVTNSLCESK